jgi:hypothetical protein
MAVRPHRVNAMAMFRRNADVNARLSLLCAAWAATMSLADSKSHTKSPHVIIRLSDDVDDGEYSKRREYDIHSAQDIDLVAMAIT